MKIIYKTLSQHIKELECTLAKEKGYLEIVKDDPDERTKSEALFTIRKLEKELIEYEVAV